METVFVQSLRSESTQTPDAAGRRAHSAAFSWDLANYYEFINHHKLYERARNRGFNLAVVSIALNRYRAKRYLGLGDVACYAGFPTRGLAAGCGWATTWAQVYSIDPLEAWTVQNPQVGITLFIDDFFGDCQAQEEHEVAGRLTAGAAALRVAIEDDLECSVAEHKSVIIASSDRLLARLKAAFGKHAGTAEKSAANLGVDSFAGRRRAHRKSTVVLRGRTDKFHRRFRRLRALKRAGYDMKELYVTGLAQATYYGTEVLGMNAIELQKAQSSYLSLLGSPTRSGSRALGLLAENDPTWRQGLGPVLTWGTICWKAATQPSFQAFVTIPQLGDLAAGVLQCLPTTWSGVKGPLGAAHLSMKRIGWRFKTPFTVESESGTELALTAISPALLQYHLVTAWKIKLGRTASRAVGIDLESQEDASVYQKTSQALGPSYRSILRAFMVHGIWSTARLYSVGYSVSPYCDKCGARDSLHHRLFECGFTEDLRTEYFEQDDENWIKNHPHSDVLLQGLQIVPTMTDARPQGIGHEKAHMESWTLSGLPIEDVLQGVVFTDGACHRPGHPIWNRAGWAVLKLSHDGVVLGWARGVVGRQLPSSAAAGESVAALAAATISEEVQEARSDYQAYIGLESQPLDRWATGRRCTQESGSKREPERQYVLVLVRSRPMTR